MLRATDGRNVRYLLSVSVDDDVAAVLLRKRVRLPGRKIQSRCRSDANLYWIQRDHHVIRAENITPQLHCEHELCCVMLYHSAAR